MADYRCMVVLLDFLVNFLLLLGTNRLRHAPEEIGRSALGAVVGGIHCALCFVPGFLFLGNFVWRMICISESVGLPLVFPGSRLFGA